MSKCVRVRVVVLAIINMSRTPGAPPGTAHVIAVRDSESVAVPVVTR